MSKMTGNQALSGMLKGYRVTHVFFMAAIFIRGLIEMERLGIKPVLAHSEKAAVYMADGYARVSHKPGICMAQSVGAANMAAGLQDPYLGVSPVIALTGVRPPSHKYRNSYQEINHVPLFEPVTKFNAEVNTVKELPFLLRQAFREATTGAPRPVHLDFAGISGEVITEAEADLDTTVEEQFSQYPAFRPQADSDRVLEAIKLISKSLKPVIVAGGGVASSRAQKEVATLAEKLSIPVAISLNGKDTILDNHPLAIGPVGSYSRKCANQIVTEADLVIFIGSHTGSQVTLDWRIPRPGTAVIQIDLDPSELGRNYPASICLLGDAKIVVQQLIDASEKTEPKKEWLQRVNQLFSDWRKETDTFCDSDVEPIRPERICRTIGTCLPPNAVVVADTGNAGIWTATTLPLTNPKQNYIRAAGSLGWAFPASLGAKCAAPDRPVICFTGDGGFWYHVAELETAARLGINTITVVNNNDSLGQVAGGYPFPGQFWRFSKVNFVALAEAMGCVGIRVTKPSDLKGALEQAFATNKPTVVDVISDSKVNPPPAWRQVQT
jgi:acetolactate synthase I/II/III large subunit